MKRTSKGKKGRKKQPVWNDATGKYGWPRHLISVAAPTEGKLDIEAIKDKVKKAKTKKLGAPPVNPAPPSSCTADKKKKNKAKSKG